MGRGPNETTSVPQDSSFESYVNVVNCYPWFVHGVLIALVAGCSLPIQHGYERRIEEWRPVGEIETRELNEISQRYVGQRIDVVVAELSEQGYNCDCQQSDPSSRAHHRERTLCQKSTTLQKRPDPYIGKLQRINLEHSEGYVREVRAGVSYGTEE